MLKLTPPNAPNIIVEGIYKALSPIWACLLKIQALGHIHSDLAVKYIIQIVQHLYLDLDSKYIQGGKYILIWQANTSRIANTSGLGRQIHQELQIHPALQANTSGFSGKDL